MTRFVVPQGVGWPTALAALDAPLRMVFVCLGLLAATPSLAQTPDRPVLEVRFGAEADYGPFVYATSDGQVRGLSVDMLALLAPKAGLRVVTQPPRPLKDLLQSARVGQLDLISSLRPTPERSAFLLFSRPYVSVPAVLVLRKSDPLRESSPAGLWQALRGQAVAVGSGYAVEGFVRSNRPEIHWQGVADDVQALRGLQQGRFAAAVVDLASLSFSMREHGLGGIEAVDAVGFDYMLSFGVRRDRPELLERIDAALLATAEAEKAAVVERWMKPLQMKQQLPSAWRVQALSGLLLLLALAVGFWGWRRSRRPDGTP